MKKVLLTIVLLCTCHAYCLSDRLCAIPDIDGVKIVSWKGNKTSLPTNAIYPIPPDIRIGLNNGSLNASNLIIENGTLRRKTENDRTVEEWKVIISTEITNKSITLASQGFTSQIQGEVKTFKCESTDATNATAVKALQVSGEIIYPYPVRGIDTVIMLVDENDASWYCGNLMRRLQTINIIEISLLDSIKNATTKEECMAIRQYNDARI